MGGSAEGAVAVLEIGSGYRFASRDGEVALRVVKRQGFTLHNLAQRLGCTQAGMGKG
jgi:hypothetical protein